MSEEALRRAAERVLTGSAISAGSKQFHDDARLLARAALSEGQAPEPVAQEPAGWVSPLGTFTRKRKEMESLEHIEWTALYTHPAGMDTARAKAIEAERLLRLWREAYETESIASDLHAVTVKFLATKGAGS